MTNAADDRRLQVSAIPAHIFGGLGVDRLCLLGGRAAEQWDEELGGEWRGKTSVERRTERTAYCSWQGGLLFLLEAELISGAGSRFAISDTGVLGACSSKRGSDEFFGFA